MAEFIYTPNSAKLGSFFGQIQKVGKPSGVTFKWLSGLGFKSSNDRYLTGILKALGFTDDSGVPIDERWMAFRNREKAGAVMAASVREAYADLFSTYPDAHRLDDEALRNFFSTHTSVGERTVAYIVRTFKALVALADFDAISSYTPDVIEQPVRDTREAAQPREVTQAVAPAPTFVPITMNIQIVIPSDATAEQYDRIFSSIRKFLTKQE